MFTKHLKHLFVLPAIFTLSLGLTSNAHAVFIDFDDIIAPPANPFGCETFEPCGLILSNEYESKGFIFEGYNWLVGGVLPDGTNDNKVLGVNTIGLRFIGNLPNFVSFNIHAPLEAEASFFYVYGENDELLFIQHSNGWMGTEETSTPYIPNELITINSAAKIGGIAISSLFNLRTGPIIDNLTFEYRTVPEPSALFLFLCGIAGVIWNRSRPHKKLAR